MECVCENLCLEGQRRVAEYCHPKSGGLTPITVHIEQERCKISIPFPSGRENLARVGTKMSDCRRCKDDCDNRDYVRCARVSTKKGFKPK